MNKIRIHTAILSATLIGCTMLTSCFDERYFPQSDDHTEGVATVHFTVEPMQNDHPDTRAVYTDESKERKISNISWFIFDNEDGQQCVAKGFESPVQNSSAMHLFGFTPETGHTYTILMTANIGNFTGKATVRDDTQEPIVQGTTMTAFEASAIHQWKMTYMTLAQGETDGLPAALPMSGRGTYTAQQQTGAVTFNVPLKRRVAKLTFAFELDMINSLSPNYQNFKIDAFTVTNIPKSISMFNTETSVYPAARRDSFQTYTMDTDNTVYKEHSNKHSNKFIDIYLPENIRGSSENPDWSTQIVLKYRHNNAIFTNVYDLPNDNSKNVRPNYWYSPTLKVENKRKGEAPANCYMVNPEKFKNNVNGNYASEGLVIPLSQAVNGLVRVAGIDSESKVDIGTGTNALSRTATALVNNELPAIIAHNNSMTIKLNGTDYYVKIVTLWTDATANRDKISGSIQSGYATLSGLGNLTTGSNIVIGLVLRKTDVSTSTANRYHADDIVLWSWHLWVTDYEPNTPMPVLGEVPGGEIQRYNTTFFNNNPTKYIMDRNLGATITEKPSNWTDTISNGIVNGDYEKYFGLTYQWGRKDPMPSRKKDALQTFANTARYSAWSGDEMVTTTTTYSTYLFDVIRNPMNFFQRKGGYYDAFENEGVGKPEYQSNTAYTEYWYMGKTFATDSWNRQSDKSVFDPCPPGWRVPKGEPWNGILSDQISWKRNNESPGALSQGAIYTCTVDSKPTKVWFPACGNLLYHYNNNAGVLDVFLQHSNYHDNVLQIAYYAPTYPSNNVTINKTNFPLRSPIVVNTVWRWSTDAIPVRCVQE